MQIGFQIRVSPLNLERVDDLVDGAQVTERWHFVADGGTQTQVAPVIKGILQGQTRIERIILVEIYAAFLPVERTCSADTHHIIQLFRFSSELAVKVSRALLHLGMVIVSVDVVVVRERMGMTDAGSPAHAV